MTIDSVMIIEILRHTPLWVWALATGLLLLGLSQLRTRRVTRQRLLLLPAVLTGLGLFSTAGSFEPAVPALAAWAAAFAAGVGLGLRLPWPAGAAWDAEGRQLQLPGSVLPLLLIATVFTMRYVGGVSLALHPAWRGAASVALPMAAVYGAVAGTLLGRVLALLRAARA